MTLPVLDGAKIRLRPPREDDAIALAHHLNDFGVSGNLARVPFPYRLSDATYWLRSRPAQTSPNDANFAIELEGSGYVGHIGFHPGAQGPVIGYWLGRPFWGQGLMSEAAQLCVDWFFQTSSAEAIYSGAFHFNAASLAIQKKLGFTETSRSWLLCLARGVEVEHIDTKLTLGVWKARRT